MNFRCEQPSQPKNQMNRQSHFFATYKQDANRFLRVKQGVYQQYGCLIESFKINKLNTISSCA
jgi:hypothetical protein